MNVTEAIPLVGAWTLVGSAAARHRMRERAAEIASRTEQPQAEHLGAPAPLLWSGVRR